MEIKIGEVGEAIVEAYSKYRENVIDNDDYENPRYLQTVIQMQPKTFLKLKLETQIFNDGKYFYVELYGRKTPIVITSDLEVDIEFIIQSRHDYERQEQEKLINRFHDMFDR
jgi:hypothetical protein